MNIKEQRHNCHHAFHSTQNNFHFSPESTLNAPETKSDTFDKRPSLARTEPRMPRKP